ncbi:rhomboid family intramembrane serine protease [Anaerocolumna sp.]|uniref:rhomboid family intramembrane serine protease n=1 Tax=Anaerocolumna sp. TaxID=2041569 RepID=UPI0028B11777|nr:rhomboid family intramembrane serine protease [Anaerocolumna sp.]
MILDMLNSCMMEKGFKKIKVNVENICVYFRNMEQEIYLLTVYEALTGQEFAKEQFRNIQSQIYTNYNNMGQILHFLTIIYTDNMEKAREMSGMDNNIWYLDNRNKRLIIYENHRDDFLGLQRELDDILYKIKNETPGYRTVADTGSYSAGGNYGANSNYRASGSYGAAGNNENDYQDTERDSGVNDEGYNQYRYNQERTRKKRTKGHVFTITNLLILINALVFLIMEIRGSTNDIYYMLDKGALYWPAMEVSHEYYRFFTYMFLHFGFDHLVNNMLVLFFIGDKLERIVGKVKYLCIYFASGLLAGIASLGYNMLKNNYVVSAGASGAIFGVVGAMAFIVLINKGRIKDISTRQMVVFVLLSLYGGLTSQGIDNAAHIGGLLSGAALAAVLYRIQKRDLERG